jgi:O-antigen/teichoic acid export membrane protein
VSAPATTDGHGVTLDAELREATVQGVRWTSLVRLATEILALGSMVVLTHLIPPAEFGAVAVLMIVNEVANGLAGTGYGVPLVQREQITRAHVEAVAAVSVLTSLALCALTMGVALVLPPSLFGARVPELLPRVAPMFLISGLTIVPRAILERRLDFGRLSANDLTTTVVSTVVSVALAIAGLDAEALLLGLLAGGLTSLVMYQRAAPMPRPRWHRREVREMVSFGLPTALSGLAYTGTRNIDYTIVSAAFGPVVTGYYYRAYLLGVDYQNKFSRVLVQILFPLFSRAGSVESMRALRARVIRANAAVVFAALGVFILTAPVLVPFVLGARWEPAVLPSQILAAGGLAMALSVGAEGMAVAAGEPRRVMAFTFLQLAVYAAIVAIATRWGLVAVCIGVGIFRWGVLTASYRVLLTRLGVPVRQLFVDAGPAVVGLAALLGVGVAVLQAADALGADPAVAAVLAGASGLAAYAIALRLAFPALWHDLVRIGGRIVLPARGSGGRRLPHRRRKPEQAPAVP